jgi:hypothetical protein
LTSNRLDDIYFLCFLYILLKLKEILSAQGRRRKSKKRQKRCKAEFNGFGLVVTIGKTGKYSQRELFLKRREV